MQGNKRQLVKSTIALIALVSLVFITFDILRFFHIEGFTEINRYIKRITVLLCMVMVWNTGIDGLSQKDTQRLKIIFITICLAETAFLIKQTIPGILLFAVCQGLLIHRNGAGFAGSAADGRVNRNKTVLVLYGAVILTIVTALIYFLFYPILGLNTLFYALIIYGLLLGTSLWTALANHRLKLFPQKNAMFVAEGMLCFFFCDFSVGFDIVIGPGTKELVVNSLIWLFYTPAITLVALSGFKMKTN